MTPLFAAVTDGMHSNEVTGRIVREGYQMERTGRETPPWPGSGIDVSRIEGQVRESSIKKVGEVVTAHPEEALAIIRTWLHQPV